MVLLNSSWFVQDLNYYSPDIVFLIPLAGSNFPKISKNV